ncbi:ribulose bisphosphate carboxylase/oxygenase activase 2, chloroplastic-like [Camellia sinensis]|uniref:ribulose bisphosphate carboxylase/oxygenase activase 2, chloroplastic-like n=1 Tax=Camellia sinensis TaxID=4442 RepID=UPI0010355CE3|nr:ribulose bisphosphate carboxylase/oxygenase activase 2, chloroplastic-like [Camellia sinensis]
MEELMARIEKYARAKEDTPGTKALNPEKKNGSPKRGQHDGGYNKPEIGLRATQAVTTGCRALKTHLDDLVREGHLRDMEDEARTGEGQARLPQASTAPPPPALQPQANDNVPDEDVVKIVDTFPGQSIDFFGALRARVYDDEVRKWISGAGVDTIGKKLVNSKEGPPTFEQPKMTLEKLLEYGYMLVQEQENVKRVQLADKYLSEAALGDANQDSIDRGTF